VKALETAVPLSDIDVDILRALETEGTKISTRDLSKILDIPDRTIRYRLNRMRDKGLLDRPIVQTYERKMGLAEKVLFLRSVPNKEASLKEIVDDIPIFYHFASTYGRYDGLIVYAMFPLAASHLVTRLAQEMKDAGLVEDYCEFDLVDYVRKGVSVMAFLPESPWEWNTWYDDIGKIMEGCETIDLGFEEFPQVVSFDFKDVQIIMNMVENAEITLKELSDILEMSQPQVHKRIKNLEENGIIRGYKPSFMPFKEGTTMGVVFKSREHAKEVLCAFHRLPFFVVFSMENANYYFVTVYLPSSDINNFLQGINRLKQHTDELFVQTICCGQGKGHLHLLTTFNEATNQWDIPVGDYIAQIRGEAKQ
jgi:DNA-binding Lrp family transcriptional regulator